MREILFRGKRVDNGEWVYGNLNILNGCIYHIVPLRVYIHTSGIPASEFYNVVPESISQFTGLTDKNGKKIFEGDICSVVKKYGTANYQVKEIGIAEVFYSEEEGCFCFREKKYMNYELYTLKAYSYKVEIIGNIHDNPELLEVK